MTDQVQAAAPAWLQHASSAADQSADSVQQLLHAVRTQLGMEVAWTSDFVSSEQVFRFVDAEPGATAPAVGDTAPMSGSFCARVLDGRVPALIPNARLDPALALLEITRELEIGCYLGAPLLAPDGSVSGMLCLTSRAPMPALDERDLATVKLLAQLLHDLQVRALDEASVQARRQELVDDLQCVIAGESRWAVLQPIVDVRTGDVVAVEGLSRFSSERTPAEWFDAASRLGLGPELELAAAGSVLDLLRDGLVRDGVAVCVNISPRTLLSADLGALLRGLDPSRLVLELTEHEPVHDYAELAAVLAPWRARGLRIAVDDAGAGYASLQHVLMCRPDLVKLDMALVRGVDADPVRRALVDAVATFARGAGMQVVAEGVETEGERAELVGLGVTQLQGFLLGAPTAPPR